MNESPYLSTAEVASELGLSQPRIYQLCERRQLPFVRRGKRILIPREAFARYLALQVDEALSVVSR